MNYLRNAGTSLALMVLFLPTLAAGLTGRKIISRVSPGGEKADK